MSRNPFTARRRPAALYKEAEVVWEREYDGETFDLEREFGRASPLILEIGPGRGDFALGTAAARAGWNYLALEISRKRSMKLSTKAMRRGLLNLLVLNCVAQEALGKLVPPACAREIQIQFPDPWPKARHHNRRMIDADLTKLLARTLESGGLLSFMSDHLEYAEEVLACFEREPRLANLAGPGRFSPATEEPRSYYLDQCLKKGTEVRCVRMKKRTQEPTSE